ncbi:MAG: hypothetical protein J6U98_04210 [Abditibacteriota bacterium]|nr:hypothetical protein [Abditibacteriota bacterium]MBP5094125.1 hypothetical protein [Abditibacteriota bacterium]MBP5718647.1 hypothetical protein [Abditibacteriota bacterium]MBP5737642.1 hypothetical protein [Abditibacteriota bacterium]
MTDIKDIETHGREELFEGLRGVTVGQNKSAFIYENCRMSLRTLSPDDVVPAQRYLLSGRLEIIARVAERLRDFGADMFDLDGFVRMKISDAPHEIDLLPPVAEVTADGITLLNDGMHRFETARRLGRTVRTVCIENVPKEYPYYAHPLPGGWSDVKIYDTLPEGERKKLYRRDFSELYRDFNSVFRNVGCPRER